MASFLSFLFYLLIVVIVLFSFSCANNNNDEDDEENRINAFRRCISDTGLPAINTSEPYCPISTTKLRQIVTNSRYQAEYHFGCDDLMKFADYIDENNLELDQLSEIHLNITHLSWLSTAAYYCRASAIRILALDYDMYLTWNVSKMYTRESCEMEFMRLVARKSDGQFSDKIYKYLMAKSLLWSNKLFYYTRRYNTAIPRHFLYTCEQQGFDTETCVLSLLNHCFELEDVYYYYPYWCYNSVLQRLCVQFYGDERTRCKIVLDIKMELSLENQCADEKNEGKCENILTGIVDNKPISQINSSDIDQIKAVVAGSAKRANYTNETLTKLNRIVDYFNLNESAVASVLDKQDATTFLTVINTLASENSTQTLAEITNNTNSSGGMLLNNLDKISKLIGIAVVSGNDKVDGKYNFNDHNVGMFLGLGSTDSESYSSGELRLNRTADSFNPMSATVTIPSTSVCNTDSIGESSGGEDYEYTYDYPKICQGRPRCTRYEDGVFRVYYDFFTLFGECSRRLHIPNTCPSVVATSIADNIPSLLSDDLPANRTVASLVLSSQIIIKNADNTTSVMHRLRNNATLNFKLIKPMNFTTDTPSCHYWDTNTMEWSSEGIETEIVSEDEVLCTTNHLTSFAVLVDHQGLFERENIIPHAERQALSIIGYIGPSFSAVCLVIAIVIMIYLRKQMHNSLLYCIHLNLCISLLLALSVLLVGLETADEVDWLCSLVAGLLHYLFLCVFAWMFSEGITLFIMVVYVWGIKFLKWYIFVPLAWVTPLLIVAISAGYRYRDYGTDNFCWLSFEKGLMWAFLGPVVVICTVNTVFLAVTMIQVIRVKRQKSQNNSKKSQNLETAKSAIVGSVILFPLLGTTWIIGIFAVSQKTTFFLWLFTIFNSLQGVFILVFHVLKHRAFLTWLSRRCPCFDRCIKVHTSSEAVRKMSAVPRSSVDYSSSTRGLQSDKFGLKAAKLQRLNTDQLQIIEEEEEEEEDLNNEEGKLSTI